MTEEETKAQRGEMTKPLRGLEFKPRTLQKAQTKEKVLKKYICKDVGYVTFFKLRRNTL